jgi:hypothetical protein
LGIEAVMFTSSAVGTFPSWKFGMIHAALPPIARSPAGQLTSTDDGNPPLPPGTGAAWLTT